MKIDIFKKKRHHEIVERSKEDAKDQKQILAYFYMKVQVLGYTKLTIQNFHSKERKKGKKKILACMCYTFNILKHEN